MVTFFDNLQEDSAICLVLQFHQVFSLFSLLMTLVKKVLGKVLKSHIIVVKVVRHEQVDIQGLELHVELVIDSSILFLDEVLAYL
jgi:hypothetical protein